MDIVFRLTFAISCGTSLLQEEEKRCVSADKDRGGKAVAETGAW